MKITQLFMTYYHLHSFFPQIKESPQDLKICHGPPLAQHSIFRVEVRATQNVVHCKYLKVISNALYKLCIDAVAVKAQLINTKNIGNIFRRLLTT